MADPSPNLGGRLNDNEDPGNYSPGTCVEDLHNVAADDQQLIRECLAGHPDAFAQLVVRHQDRLYNTLAKMLGSADEARDVAQDAFVHAFQKLGTFRGTSAFYSWLFRIAVNAAISQRRKTKRIAASLDTLHEQSGVETADPHPAARPSHTLELSEQQAQVRRALAELSDEFRTVMVLKEMEGLKYEEIAELLDIPVGTVRSRIHRARSELRQKLTSLFSDE